MSQHDHQALVPKHKLDLDTAKAAVQAGYPAVEPILGALVTWLQDYNWPVAKVLAPFLASIGRPLIPHIDHVFSTNDVCWHYWMIVCLIKDNSQLCEHYQDKLKQLANTPTAHEQHHELDDVARDALAENGDNS